MPELNNVEQGGGWGVYCIQVMYALCRRCADSYGRHCTTTPVWSTAAVLSPTLRSVCDWPGPCLYRRRRLSSSTTRGSLTIPSSRDSIRRILTLCMSRPLCGLPCSRVRVACVCLRVLLSRDVCVLMRITREGISVKCCHAMFSLTCHCTWLLHQVG